MGPYFVGEGCKTRSHPGGGRGRQGSDQRHLYTENTGWVGRDAPRRRP